MKTLLTNIWLQQYDGNLVIRADFSNDRHFAALVSKPQKPRQISDALLTLAKLIGTDESLDANHSHPNTSQAESQDLRR